MDKTKITNHQLFALTASFIAGSTILVISATVATQAKQDSWISVLILMAFTPLQIWLIRSLWSRCPGLTYVEMIKLGLGKWLGAIVAIGFIYFCLLSAAQITSYLGSFMTLQVMNLTPVYFINAIFVATIVIAVLYGIEAIARSYEIFVYFVSSLFLLSMLLVLPNAKIENMLPVFEKGITPALKGSFILSSFLIFPSVVLLMIFPAHTRNTKKTKGSLVRGYLWGEFLVLTSIVFSILVLGSKLTSSTMYPVYLLAKEINLGTIFNRLEFIVAAVWILTLLLRGIIYFYSAVLGLAQLLGLKDHKKIILPMGLLVLINSGVVYDNAIYEANWDTFVWPPFIITFGLILPVLLLLVLLVKKTKRGS